MKIKLFLLVFGIVFVSFIVFGTQSNFLMDSSIDEAQAEEIKLSTVPTCQNVDATFFDEEFSMANSDVVENMMQTLETIISANSFWNNLFAPIVNSNPFVNNVSIVSSSFVNGSPDWTISVLPNSFLTNSNVFPFVLPSQLQDSFLLFEEIFITSQNDLNVVVDVTIFTGNTYRISGTLIGEFWIKNYIDVNGSFDFKDSNLGGVVTSVGNGKKFYGDFYPFQYISPDTEELVPANNFWFKGIENYTVESVWSNGSLTDVTDPVVLAVAETISQENFVNALVDNLSANDYDRVMRDIVDGIGVMHARKILENAAPYSHKDNLITFWIEGSGTEYAFVCDTGVRESGWMHPASIKPHDIYVENGSDYNF